MVKILVSFSLKYQRLLIRCCIKGYYSNNVNLELLVHSMTGYRGSYMSAHVLLNLLNELGKRDKMRGLSSILSLFRNEFNKLNNTSARMLDSIYHMALRSL